MLLYGIAMKSILKDIVSSGNIAPVALRMPERYAKEMLADWRGAGRAYGNPDTKAWYLKRRNNIILHHDTRQWVEEQLFE